MKIQVVRVHQLNPNNPDDENMAHFLVRDQLYLDNNSAFQRLKKAILKKKRGGGGSKGGNAQLYSRPVSSVCLTKSQTSYK